MFYFHIVLGGGGSFRRMITTPLMLGAVGVGVYQLQSQGLAPSNRQLAAALVGAVPRLLQLEIVVLVLMIFFGGQSVLTYATRLRAWHLRNSRKPSQQLSGGHRLGRAFYLVILPMLIKAGMLVSPFDAQHWRELWRQLQAMWA